MKGVLVHAALALCGLLFAYQTWLRPAEEEGVQVDAGAVVLACSEANLETIEMESPTHFIAIAPARSQGADTAYWITTRRKTKSELDAKEPAKGAAGAAAPAPAPAPATKPGEPEAEGDATDPHATPDAPAEPNTKTVDPTVPERFLANATFRDYLKRMTPLLAARELGELPKDKLADFGFDAVGTRVTLGCAGKRVTLESGARTFGTAQRYLRDAKTHVAYLFDDSFVSDLQAAQYKFMQNDVHGFTFADVDDARVSAGGKEKRLLHRERKLEDRATWVDADEPTKRNELYDNWFSRLSKLRVRKYLADGAEPGTDLGSEAKPAAITPVLTIAYGEQGKPKGKLELVKVEVGPESHYYARTETTRTWVSLYDSSAKEVEADVGLVVGAEEASESKPAQSAAPVAPLAPTAPAASPQSPH